MISKDADLIAEAYSRVNSSAKMNQRENKAEKLKENQDYDRSVITPGVKEYVLGLMAENEGLSVEDYLAIAKQALSAAGVQVSDEEFAEKLVQSTFNNLSPEQRDEIISLASGR